MHTLTDKKVKFVFSNLAIEQIIKIPTKHRATSNLSQIGHIRNTYKSLAFCIVYDS